MLASLACLLTGMWLSSYSFYTSLGVDTERAEGATVRSTYYRVRWPGDGSFRVGGGALGRPLTARPVQPFDLGGTFFQPARRSVPRSLWNRLGFWWVEAPEEWDGEQLLWTWWIGIPSWLLPTAAGALTVLVNRASRSRG